MQNILLIFWHFVHRLTEQQCKDYVGISKKANHTVVDWYRTCREVCTDWIWDNTPMLGGYGKIIEMDESYFAGAPKYNHGRRLGTSWDEQEIDKWGFCLTERGRENWTCSNISSCQQLPNFHHPEPTYHQDKQSNVLLQSWHWIHRRPRTSHSCLN